MTETKRRILTVCGSIITAAAIALALLAFIAINASAATTVPPVSDIIPDVSDMTMPGTGEATLPNNITSNNTDDVLTPNDTSRAPASTSTPETTGGMAEDDGGSGLLGAVIAVIVVVAIILVVIALIPRKK